MCIHPKYFSMNLNTYPVKISYLNTWYEERPSPRKYSKHIFDRVNH